MRDHPVIERIMRTGYPEPEPEHWGMDALGNEVLEGDIIYRLDDYNGEFFLADELSYDAQQILNMIGAKKVRAEGRR